MNKISGPIDEIRTAPGPVETAAGILGQLLKFAQQLAASETDPGVEVPALSQALGLRIEELKKVLPEAFRKVSSKSALGGGDSKEKLWIEEKIRELQTQTLVSLEALQRAKARTASELGNLARTTRAIRAYSP